MRWRARRVKPRARTLPVKRMQSRQLREDAAEYAVELAIERPKTRGDCVGGVRPCPWAGCRHHLAIEVNADTGSIKTNFPQPDVYPLPQSCSLDVAALGALTLEQVGALTNLTRERTRQIEESAIDNLKRSLKHRGIGNDALAFVGLAQLPELPTP